MKKVEYVVDDFLCDDCGEELMIYKGSSHTKDGDNYYCQTCALKRGLLSPMEWLNGAGFGYFDKATFDGRRILAYKKWGKGYTKSEIIIEKE